MYVGSDGVCFRCRLPRKEEKNLDLLCANGCFVVFGKCCIRFFVMFFNINRVGRLRISSRLASGRFLQTSLGKKYFKGLLKTV